MTPTEIKYVEKLKEYIKKVDKIIGNWEMSEITLTKIRREIAELGKQCQFEMLCDPDIFEASANEHFEQVEKKQNELISISAKLIGEIVDNYEADAINLPAEMYNELKFHLKQLQKQLI